MGGFSEIPLSATIADEQGVAACGEGPASSRVDGLTERLAHRQARFMEDIDQVWERIRRHAGEEFRTVTGLAFTYDAPGNYLRLHRTNRSLSKTNFAKALPAMPADGPGAIADRQGASYTWAILMDERIRRGDW